MSGFVAFGSIEFRVPLEVSSDVRPPVQVRLGPKAFSRDYPEDSDIPLPCEMKDEPTFKPLQGNPTFFRVRELASTGREAANSLSLSHTGC